MIHSKFTLFLIKQKWMAGNIFLKMLIKKGGKLGWKFIRTLVLKRKELEYAKKINGKIIPMIIIFILKSTNPVSFQRKFKNIF